MAVAANRDARSRQEHVAVEVNRDAERAVEDGVVVVGRFGSLTPPCSW